MELKSFKKVTNSLNTKEVNLHKLYYDSETNVIYFPEEMIFHLLEKNDKDKYEFDQLASLINHIMDDGKADILFKNKESINDFYDKFEITKEEKDKMINDAEGNLMIEENKE